MLCSISLLMGSPDPVDGDYTRGVLVTLPAQHPDDNANQQGLKREYQNAGANRLCAFRFALRIQVGESFRQRSLSFWSLGIEHL